MSDHNLNNELIENKDKIYVNQVYKRQQSIHVPSNNESIAKKCKTFTSHGCK